MRVRRCAANPGMELIAAGVGGVSRCDCCADHTFCASMPSATPSILSCTFSGLALCSGCRLLRTGPFRSASTTFVLDGTFDLACHESGGATDFWYYTSPAGNYGSYASSDATCTSTVTLEYLTMFAQIVTIPLSVNQRVNLNAYLSDTLPPPGSSGPVRLYTGQRDMSPDCMQTVSALANGNAACSSPSFYVNYGGEADIVPS